MVLSETADAVLPTDTPPASTPAVAVAVAAVDVALLAAAAAAAAAAAHDGDGPGPGPRSSEMSHIGSIVVETLLRQIRNKNYQPLICFLY